MDKDDVIHIYKGVLTNCKKNEIGSLVDMWTDLKYIIQSEIG